MVEWPGAIIAKEVRFIVNAYVHAGVKANGFT